VNQLVLRFRMNRPNRDIGVSLPIEEIELYNSPQIKFDFVVQCTYDYKSVLNNG
jgi:hypothetical protein